MTEYTPTEPEITAARAYLVDHLREPRHMPADVAADILTLAVVKATLGLVDEPDAERVRAARAALVARQRWAEQETKATA